MNNFDLVYPMFAMVCLTFMVAMVMFATRIYGARTRAVRVKYFKLLAGEAPDFMLKPARHFTNLFETPVLFYAVCLTAMVTQTADETLRNMAWVYVTLRVAHAAIHIGPNKIYPRLFAFFASFTLLVAMWIVVVLRLPS